MYYLYLMLNYLDALLPVENVKSHTDSMKINSFNLGLKFFDILLILGVDFAIMKFVQFVASLFFKADMHEINIYYLVGIFLLMIEIGISEWKIFSLKSFPQFLLRATVKTLVLVGIDKCFIWLFL